MLRFCSSSGGRTTRKPLEAKKAICQHVFGGFFSPAQVAWNDFTQQEKRCTAIQARGQQETTLVHTSLVVKKRITLVQTSTPVHSSSSGDKTVEWVLNVKKNYEGQQRVMV